MRSSLQPISASAPSATPDIPGAHCRAQCNGAVTTHPYGFMQMWNDGMPWNFHGAAMAKIAR
jgi:hypothetical protein